MAWDDDKRAKAIEMYQERNPTPETSVEILKELAEELGESVNGVRMILTKAEVYIKKDQTTKTPSAKAGATGSTRVSKEQSHTSLTEAIEAHGQTADSEIISKLTGKAAVYFAAIFNGITKE